MFKISNKLLLLPNILIELMESGNQENTKKQIDIKQIDQNQLRGGGCGNTKNKSIKNEPQKQIIILPKFLDQFKNYINILIEKANLLMNEDQSQNEVMIAIQWFHHNIEEIHIVSQDEKYNSQASPIFLEKIESLLGVFPNYVRSSSFLTYKVLQIINEILKVFFVYQLQGKHTAISEQRKLSLIQCLNVIDQALEANGNQIWQTAIEYELTLIKIMLHNCCANYSKGKEILLKFIKNLGASIYSLTIKDNLISSIMEGAEYLFQAEFAKVRYPKEIYFTYYYFQILKWKIIYAIRENQSVLSLIRQIVIGFQSFIAGSKNWVVHYTWVQLVCDLLSYRIIIDKDSIDDGIQQEERWSYLIQNDLIKPLPYQTQGILELQKINQLSGAEMTKYLPEIKFKLRNLDQFFDALMYDKFLDNQDFWAIYTTFSFKKKKTTKGQTNSQLIQTKIGLEVFGNLLTLLKDNEKQLQKQKVSIQKIIDDIIHQKEKQNVDKFQNELTSALNDFQNQCLRLLYLTNEIFDRVLIIFIQIQLVQEQSTKQEFSQNECPYKDIEDSFKDIEKSIKNLINMIKSHQINCIKIEIISENLQDKQQQLEQINFLEDSDDCQKLIDCSNKFMSSEKKFNAHIVEQIIKLKKKPIEIFIDYQILKQKIQEFTAKKIMFNSYFNKDQNNQNLVTQSSENSNENPKNCLLEIYILRKFVQIIIILERKNSAQIIQIKRQMELFIISEDAKLKSNSPILQNIMYNMLENLEKILTQGLESEMGKNQIAQLIKEISTILVQTLQEIKKINVKNEQKMYKDETVELISKFQRQIVPFLNQKNQNYIQLEDFRKAVQIEIDNLNQQKNQMNEHQNRDQMNLNEAFKDQVIQNIQNYESSIKELDLELELLINYLKIEEDVKVLGYQSEERVEQYNYYEQLEQLRTKIVKLIQDNPNKDQKFQDQIFPKLDDKKKIEEENLVFIFQGCCQQTNILYIDQNYQDILELVNQEVSKKKQWGFFQNENEYKVRECLVINLMKMQVIVSDNEIIKFVQWKIKEMWVTEKDEKVRTLLKNKELVEMQKKLFSQDLRSFSSQILQEMKDRLNLLSSLEQQIRLEGNEDMRNELQKQIYFAYQELDSYVDNITDMSSQLNITLSFLKEITKDLRQIKNKIDILSDYLKQIGDDVRKLRGKKYDELLKIRKNKVIQQAKQFEMDSIYVPLKTIEYNPVTGEIIKTDTGKKVSQLLIENYKDISSTEIMDGEINEFLWKRQVKEIGLKSSQEDVQQENQSDYDKQKEISKQDSQLSHIEQQEQDQSKDEQIDKVEDYGKDIKEQIDDEQFNEKMENHLEDQQISWEQEDQQMNSSQQDESQQSIQQDDELQGGQSYFDEEKEDQQYENEQQEDQFSKDEQQEAGSFKHQQQNNFYQKNEKIVEKVQDVLILRGEAGSGKSRAARKIEEFLWRAHGTISQWIPIFIFLPSIKNPKYNLFEQALDSEYYNFDQVQIREFKEAIRSKKVSVIFIFDSYDEMKIDCIQQNLIMTNKFIQDFQIEIPGKTVKFIITTRNEILHPQRYRTWFYGFSLETLKDVELVKFDQKQIDDYLKKYVELSAKRKVKYLYEFIKSIKNQDFDWNEFKEVWSLIDQIVEECNNKQNPTSQQLFSNKEEEMILQILKSHEIFQFIKQEQIITLKKDLQQLWNSNMFQKSIDNVNISQLLTTPFMLEIVVQVLPQMIQKQSGSIEFKEIFVKNMEKLLKKQQKSKEKIIQYSNQIFELQQSNKNMYQVRHKDYELQQAKSILDELEGKKFFNYHSPVLDLNVKNDKILINNHSFELKKSAELVVVALKMKQYTNYEFYDSFVSYYHLQQVEKLRQLGKVSNYEGFIIDVQNFSQSLALDFMMNQQTQVSYKQKGKLKLESNYLGQQTQVSWDDQYFQDQDENLEYKKLIRSCLLLTRKGNSYSFSHKSVQEFLVAKFIFDSIAQIKIDNGNQIFENSKDQLLNNLLNNDKFNVSQVNYSGVLKLLKKQFEQLDDIDEKLISIVLLSKELLYQRSSSNSICLLSNQGTFLGGRNFKSINLKDTNVCGLSFFGSDLTESKFDNVQIDSCNFSFCNLENNNWQNIVCKEQPNLLEHTSTVYQVSFSKDGKYLASGGSNSELFIWNMQTYEREIKFDVKQKEVCCVKYVKEDTLLVSGADNIIIIWDVNEKKSIVQLDDYSDIIKRIVFSEDEQLMASVHANGLLVVWNFDNLFENKDFNLGRENKKIINIEIDLTQNYLYVIDEVSNQLQCYEINSKKCVNYQSFKRFKPKNFTLSKNNQYIALIDDFSALCILEVVDKTKFRIVYFEEGMQWISNVYFAYDSQALSILSSGRILNKKIVNLQETQGALKFINYELLQISSIDDIIAVFDGKIIYFLDQISNQVINTLDFSDQSKQYRVKLIQFSSQKRQFLIRLTYNTTFWDLFSFQQQFELMLNFENQGQFITDDFQYFIFFHQNFLQIQSVEKMVQAKFYLSFEEIIGKTNDFALNENFQILAFCKQKQLKIINLEDMEQDYLKKINFNYIIDCVTFSNNGSFILLSLQNGQIVIVKNQTFEWNEFEKFESEINCLTISKDDTIIGIISDNQIQLINYLDKKIIYQKQFQEPLTTKLIFSSVGQMIAVGCSNTIFIYDYSKNEEFFKDFDTLAISDIAFSPFEKLLAAVNVTSIIIWNLETNQMGISKLLQKEEIKFIFFFKDSKSIITASNYIIRIWNISKEYQIIQYMNKICVSIDISNYLEIKNIKISQDLQQIVIYTGNKIQIFGLDEFFDTQILQLSKKFCFSVNLQQLSLYMDQMVYLIPFKNSQQIKVLEIGSVLDAISFTSDNQLMVTFGENMLTFWKTAPLVIVSTFKFGDCIKQILFSQNENILICQEVNSLTIYNIENLQKIEQVEFINIHYSTRYKVLPQIYVKNDMIGYEFSEKLYILRKFNINQTIGKLIINEKEESIKKIENICHSKSGNHILIQNFYSLKIFNSQNLKLEKKLVGVSASQSASHQDTFFYEKRGLKKNQHTLRYVDLNNYKEITSFIRYSSSSHSFIKFLEQSEVLLSGNDEEIWFYDFCQNKFNGYLGRILLQNDFKFLACSKIYVVFKCNNFVKFIHTKKLKQKLNLQLELDDDNREDSSDDENYQEIKVKKNNQKKHQKHLLRQSKDESYSEQWQDVEQSEFEVEEGQKQQIESDENEVDEEKSRQLIDKKQYRQQKYENDKKFVQHMNADQKYQLQNSDEERFIMQREVDEQEYEDNFEFSRKETSEKKTQLKPKTKNGKFVRQKIDDDEEQSNEVNENYEQYMQQSQKLINNKEDNFSIFITQNEMLLSYRCYMEIWNFRTFTFKQKQFKLGNQVTNAIFLNSANILYTIGQSIYSIETQNLENNPENHFGDQSQKISCLSLSKDKSLLVSGGLDQNVIVWDIQGKQKIAIFSGHQESIQSVDFSPDGKFIASGGYDSIIKLWNLNIKQTSNLQEGHSKNITYLTFSPDGQMLASASEDYSIMLWSVKKKKCQNVLCKHDSKVLNLLFSQDQIYLMSGSEDGTFIIWNLLNQNEIKMIAIVDFFRLPVHKIISRLKNTKIALFQKTKDQSYISFLDFQNIMIKNQQKHIKISNEIRDLKFHQKSQMLLYIQKDKLNFAEYQNLKIEIQAEFESELLFFKMSKNNSDVIYTLDQKSKLILWKKDQQNKFQKLREFDLYFILQNRSPIQDIISLDISNCQNNLYIFDKTNTLTLCKLNQIKQFEIKSLENWKFKQTSNFYFASNLKIFAVIDGRYNSFDIILYQFGTNICINTFKKCQGDFEGLFFYETFLICASSEVIYAWDLKSGELTNKIESEGYIWDIQKSENTFVYWCENEEGTRFLLKSFNILNNTQEILFKCVKQYLVGISIKGTYAYFKKKDKRLCIYKIGAKQKIKAKNTEQAYQITFHPNDRIVAIGFQNNEIQIRDIYSQEILCKCQNQLFKSILIFKFSIDGSKIFVTNPNQHTVTLLSLKNEKELHIQNHFWIKFGAKQVQEISDNVLYILNFINQFFQVDLSTLEDYNRFYFDTEISNAPLVTQQNLIYITTKKDSILIFDANKKLIIKEISFKSIQKLYMSPNDEMFAITNQGSFILIESDQLEKYNKMENIKAHLVDITVVQISDDLTLFATRCKDLYTKVWNIQNIKKPQLILVSRDQNAPEIFKLSFSYDSQLLARNTQNSIIIIEIKNRWQESIYQNLDNEIIDIKSQDSRLILVMQNELLQIELEKGFLQHIKQFKEQIYCFEISHNQQILAFGKKNGKLSIQQIDQDRQSFLCGEDRNEICALAFSPDDQLLLSGGKDRKIRLWNLEQKLQIASYQSQNDQISYFIFSPDFLHFAGGYRNGAIELFIYNVNNKTNNKKYSEMLEQLRTDGNQIQIGCVKVFSQQSLIQAQGLKFDKTIFPESEKALEQVFRQKNYHGKK